MIRKILSYLAAVAVGAALTVAGQTIAQNVNLSGAFYQYGGLGVGQAPTGVSGGIVAKLYSYPSLSSLAITTGGTTLAPTNGVTRITGSGPTTAMLSTITVPAACSPTCVIALLPAGNWATVTGGNIGKATTAVTSQTMFMTWDGAIWNPSY